MDKEKLAKEAYAEVFGDDPENPPFDALPKSKQYELLECAEKGGDAGTFGSKIQELIAKQIREENPVSDNSGDLLEPESSLEPENHDSAEKETAESLMKLKKADLTALAAERGIAVTEDNNKSEIVAALLVK